jgi:ureidoglycolate hydrolase
MLAVQPATATALAPYGRLLEPEADGVPFAAAGGLDLGRGTPRFYLMRLPRRPLLVDRITRHRQVTQCLAALEGEAWMLVLAPPGAADDPAAVPDCRQLAAFRFSGRQAVILHRGTWHAGPLFAAAEADFVNLELADTNQVDHHTLPLDRPYALAMPDAEVRGSALPTASR